MGLFYGFYGQFIGQVSGILYLYTIIVYGNSNGAARIVELAMAECVCKSFTQCLGRYLQFLFSLEANYLAAYTEVFEQEGHTGIQQCKEIAVCTLIVYELYLVIATESGHTQKELRELAGITKEQSCSCILKFAIGSEF